jgi:FkbM family methyltransferase
VNIKSILRKIRLMAQGRNIWRGYEDLFQVIYGRLPDRQEQNSISNLPTMPLNGDRLAILRALINGFDHQTHPTGFAIRFAEQDVEYVAVSGNEVAIDRSDLAIGLPLKQGCYEPHLIQFYQDRLKPGMTFVDIGANVGTYAMVAAGLVGAEGKVICFEPNSENCRLILLGAHRNGFEHVTLFPVALGNRQGHVLFSTHIGSNGGLVPDVALVNPTCVVVPVLRLDDAIAERIDCLKVDVEGAEGLVLQGAVGLIEKYRPLVTSEFSLEMLPRVSGMSGVDYLRFFVDRGYEVNLIDRQTNALVPIPDIEIFVREYGNLSRIEDLAFIPKNANSPSQTTSAPTSVDSEYDRPTDLIKTKPPHAQ